MWHTEKDAKDMRCCGPEGCGEVPRPSLKDGRHCIGARCMAWEWSSENTQKSGSHYRDNELQERGYRFVSATGNTKIFEREPLGRCGYAAGKTEAAPRAE